MNKDIASPQLYKILFIGPMGAGKTTAIACLSDAPPITTESDNTDAKQSDKPTTTVAMDYGTINLGEDQVHLYGIPGQPRFQFMWPILARGSLACIVLIDDTRPDPLADLTYYLQQFSELIEQKAFAVGISKTAKDGQSLAKYQHYFMQLDQYAPIFEVDVRDKADVLMLLEVILVNQELRG